MVIKEINFNSFKLPPDFGGPKYTMGSRMGGIEVDSKRLKAFRRLVKRNEPQAEFISFPSTIGRSPGVKINPPRSNMSFNKTISAVPVTYSPKEVNNVQKHIKIKKSKKSKKKRPLHLFPPGPGEYFTECGMDNLMNYMHSIPTKIIRKASNTAKVAKSLFGPGDRKSVV